MKDERPGALIATEILHNICQEDVIVGRLFSPGWLRSRVAFSSW